MSERSDGPEFTYEAIPVIYVGDPVDGEKGLFSAARELPARLGMLNPDKFGQNLAAVCGRLAASFRTVGELTESFEVESFEVSLDLTAKGEVRLIGSASSEIRGGIKITFRRV